MAKTLKPLSLTFDATNDGQAFTSPRTVVGVTFQGTGLTVGQRIVARTLPTVGQGSVLVDTVVMAATDDKELWGGRVPQTVIGISLDNTTVAGTWALTFFLAGSEGG